MTLSGLRVVSRCRTASSRTPHSIGSLLNPTAQIEMRAQLLTQQQLLHLHAHVHLQFFCEIQALYHSTNCQILVIGQRICTAKKLNTLCRPEVKNTTFPSSIPAGSEIYRDRWKLVPVYWSKGLWQCHSPVLTHVQTYRNTWVETRYT